MQEHATRRGWTIAAQNNDIASDASEREQRERRSAPARRRDVTF
jgi:hypothetical protein